MTDDEHPRPIGFFHVRLWLGLFVVGCVFELVTGFAENQHLSWPPSLVYPAVFATIWTGLSIAQDRYNASRPR